MGARAMSEATNQDMNAQTDRHRWLQPTDFKLTGFVPRAFLEVARATVRGMVGKALPKPSPGRTAQLLALVEGQVDGLPLFSMFPHVGVPAVRLRIDESFGKPLLVTVDLLFSDMDHILAALDEDEQHALRVLVSDVLDRVVRVLWDNPLVAPIAIRGRVLVARDPADENAQVVQSQGSFRNRLQVLPREVLVVDMQGLGFTDEIARTEDLFERYGPAASDPNWRP